MINYKVLEGTLKEGDTIEMLGYHLTVKCSSRYGKTFRYAYSKKYCNDKILREFICVDIKKRAVSVITERLGCLSGGSILFGQRPETETLEELSVLVDELLFIIINKSTGQK